MTNHDTARQLDARFAAAADAFLAAHPDACRACIDNMLDDANADPYFHLDMPESTTDAELLALPDFDARFATSLALPCDCDDD